MADFTINMTRLETIQVGPPQITPPCQDPSTSQLYNSLELSTSNRSIRLLRLDQNRSFDAPLTGKLQVVFLTRFSYFTALSYVWGTFSSPSDTITCNGVSVNISTNCRDALREIRWQSESRVTIWVDAICINQADMVERSTQIRLMRKVYSWASHVYIWLGKGNDMSDKAFACLSRASRLRMALIGVRAVSGPQRATSIINVILKLADISWNPIKIRDRYLGQKYVWKQYRPEHLDEVLSQPWISRSWTFQEIILAQTPILLCGHGRLTWDDFLSGLEYLRKPQHSDRRSIIDGSFLLPKSYTHWASLVDIWMHVPRGTEWNGRWQGWPGRASREAPTVAFYASVFASVYTKVDAYPSLKFYIITLIPIVVSMLIELEYIFYILIVMVIVAWVLVMRRFSRFWHPDYIGPVLSSIYDPSDTGRTSNTIVEGILQCLYERHASNPRDRAYALHGVLETAGFSLTPVDYEKSPGHVYHDLYSDFLNGRPEFINLLMDAGESLDRFDKPTWVPNWETVTRDSWFPPAYRYTPEALPSATLRSPPQIRVLGAELHVEVQLRGMITFCSGPFEGVSSSKTGGTENDMGRVIKARDTTTEGDATTEGDTTTEGNTTENPINQDAARKMITIILRWLSILRENAPLTPAYDIGRRAAFDILKGFSQHSEPDDFEGFEKFFVLSLEVLRVRPGEANDLDAEAADMLRRLALDRTASEYFTKTCERLAEKRNLFALESGHVGTGPPGMVEGDMVALIPGVDVPMVIRVSLYSSDSWIVIGPAVVHGMMHGDEFDETQLKTIVLV